MHSCSYQSHLVPITRIKPENVKTCDKKKYIYIIISTLNSVNTYKANLKIWQLQQECECSGNDERIQHNSTQNMSKVMRFNTSMSSFKNKNNLEPQLRKTNFATNISGRHPGPHKYFPVTTPPSPSLWSCGDRIRPARSLRT